MLGWIIGGIVALVLVLVFIGFYNKIIRLDNNIENAWSQIDVQLRRRADLIPNLVETVKGYAAHEKGVLENVTQARSALLNAKGPQEANEANNMLTGALKTLFAVSENYPQLKANENFLSLQHELTATENKVAFSRQHYNDVVLNYNNAVTTFPGNLFAGFMSKSRKPMLESPPEARELPKVRF